MSTMKTWNRREFLSLSGLSVTGFLLGFYLPLHPKPGEKEAVFAPNAWINIRPDDRIILWVREMEMGQGVRTALPMLLADELEANWEQVEVRQAYTAPAFGELGTGGSSSVRTAWIPMRKAGAAARTMLVQAAAQEWDVPVSECRAERGKVIHVPSGREKRYGELVEAASQLPVPEEPPLKDPSAFQYIGRSMPKVDTPEKVTGKAVFGLDKRVPGMVVASVEHCPVFGGSVRSVDAGGARAVPGVIDVVEVPAVGAPVHVPAGVAVVAESTWAALKGRRALRVTWDEGPHADESSESLREQMAQLTEQPAKPVRNTGNVEEAFTSAARVIEAVYELPYLAHAPMEPMNALADVREDGVEVWAPIQTPSWTQRSIAEALQVPVEKVRVYPTLLGGGFGRRLNPDVPVEAALIARAVGRPVQVVWTREDDIQHDFCRPASFHRFRAAIDAKSQPVGWLHRIATPSISAFINPGTNRPESSEVSGAADLPYGIPHIRVEYAMAQSGVPRGWLRSVEHSFNGFVVNAFMDELAEACGQDPVHFRLHLLERANPDELEAVMRQRYGDLGPYAFRLERFRRVLELAAEKAGWGRTLSPGRGMGVAVHWSFRTYVAEVAEVTIRDSGRVRIDRVVCVVDCGQVVNPRVVEEQMVGGIIYGLSALKAGIDIRNGRVVQRNFDTYEIMRMDEAPEVEVHIVESTASPSGTGEPGLPPALAAVANAIYQATGERIRRLPLSPGMLG